MHSTVNFHRSNLGDCHFTVVYMGYAYPSSGTQRNIYSQTAVKEKGTDTSNILGIAFPSLDLYSAFSFILSYVHRYKSGNVYIEILVLLYI